MIIFRAVLSYFYWLLRPVVKWFLRRTTKLCELQRICYGDPSGAPRTLGVEFSLSHSKTKGIKELIACLDERCSNLQFNGKHMKHNIEYAIITVLHVKRINPAIHVQFFKSFGRTVEQIWGYKQLYLEVEGLRQTPYDSFNDEHENMLLRLWDLLLPDTPLKARVTKQWQDIGFQGDDPKTDFRGMGLLGLHNLVYFAENYSKAAQHVLSHSLHPVYGYAFAIVGINLTSLAYHLMQDGSAKTHIFNYAKGCPVMRHFHQLYCYLFYEFDRFWFEAKPKNIMEFENIKDKFEVNIRTALANPSTVFRINIAIDTV